MFRLTSWPPIWKHIFTRLSAYVVLDLVVLRGSSSSLCFRFCFHMDRVTWIFMNHNRFQSKGYSHVNSFKRPLISSSFQHQWFIAELFKMTLLLLLLCSRFALFYQSWTFLPLLRITLRLSTGKELTSWLSACLILLCLQFRLDSFLSPLVFWAGCGNRLCLNCWSYRESDS